MNVQVSNPLGGGTRPPTSDPTGHFMSVTTATSKQAAICSLHRMTTIHNSLPHDVKQAPLGQCTLPILPRCAAHSPCQHGGTKRLLAQCFADMSAHPGTGPYTNHSSSKGATASDKQRSATEQRPTAQLLMAIIQIVAR